MFKKRGLFLVMFVLLSAGVFAQGFGFDFGFGRGRTGGFGAGSGVSNAITSALDLIFGGIVRPVFDAIRFDFYGAVKLALWIVLYLVFSNVFKNFFGGRGMPPKFVKVIAAIIALFSVAFIPEVLLDLVFRDFLSGLIGLLLLVAVIALPLYYLFKWGRDNEGDRTVNLVSALLFFLLMIIFSEMHNQFVYAFNYGFVQSLTSLIVTFGIVFALIMFIQRLIVGFKKPGGERREERREERGEREERRDDGSGDAKAMAGRAEQIAQEMLNGLRDLSDEPSHLAYELAINPNGINFIRTHSHNLYSAIHSTLTALQKIGGKNKGKAKNFANNLNQALNNLHAVLDDLSRRSSGLGTHVNACRHHFGSQYGRHDFNTFNTWFVTQANHNTFFTNLSQRLNNVEPALEDLIAVLSQIQSL